MGVSERGRVLLQIALGWPLCSRNYYVASAMDRPEWEALRAAGYAEIIGTAGRSLEPLPIYAVTDLGRQLLGGG